MLALHTHPYLSLYLNTKIDEHGVGAFIVPTFPIVRQLAGRRDVKLLRDWMETMMAKVVFVPVRIIRCLKIRPRDSIFLKTYMYIYRLHHDKES